MSPEKSNGPVARMKARIQGIRITPARVVLAALLLIFAWRVYDADDGIQRDPTLSALEHGRTFAGYILDGKKDELGRVVFATAEDKFAKEGLPSTRDVVLMFDEPVVPYRSPLWDAVKVTPGEGQRGSGPMRVAAYARVGRVHVITFVGGDSTSSAHDVLMEGKPMTATVLLLHFLRDEDENWVKLLGRKIGRALWFSDETVERGHWSLADYDFSYNRRGYYDWVRANGPRLQGALDKENAEFRTKLDKDPTGVVTALLNRAKGKADASLLSDLDHAYEAARGQIETVKAEAARTVDD